jgi:choline dehydrogenase-like flavoprotein
MSRQALHAAGATDLLGSGLVTPAYHFMGTACMGTDPRKSVVDASHRAHDVANLYVVDGGSFTTSAAVNPTSTIGAFALRAADRIWEERKA